MSSLGITLKVIEHYERYRFYTIFRKGKSV